jgi:hypothetical protein
MRLLEERCKQDTGATGEIILEENVRLYGNKTIVTARQILRNNNAI